MDNRVFSELILEKGKTYGLQDMEVYIEENRTMSIKAFNGSLDKYTVSKERVLAMRGIYDGKMGYSYMERLEPDMIDTLITAIIHSASNNDSGDRELIRDNSHMYKCLYTPKDKLADIKPEEKIQLVLTMEKEAMRLDKRVQSVDYCFYEEENKRQYIMNSKGLELDREYSTATALLSVVVQEGGDIKTGSSSCTGSQYSDFDPTRLSKEAVHDAVTMLKASSIKSGEYEVLLRNNVAATLLEGFAPVFFADRVQKSLSLLKDKTGSSIADKKVSLLDDPLMANGARSRVFDDEATPTERKYIIRDGILETCLHNNKTAVKELVQSTGNGVRISHKTGIGIGPTNMYFAAGENNLEEIIESMRNGIMIIDIQGTHAGINALSGDFSLSSCGYLIKEGRIVRPVNQITIAGNFYNMLKNIEMVGNDIRFVMPGIGYFGSPSLKIKGLTVAGE